MADQIIEIEGGWLQHGPANDRVYIMSISPDRAEAVIEQAGQLAQNRGYSKIFAKLPGVCRDLFLEHGYRVEASFPVVGAAAGPEAGTEEVLFMSLFLKPQRKLETARLERLRILELAREKYCPADRVEPATLPEGLEFALCSRQDCPAMAELYARVFASYPFPIDEAAYLAETMAVNVVYFGLWEQADRRLVALSSAEIGSPGKLVEMTDFATDPNCRSRGFGAFLLQQMELEMRRRDMLTAYTIARAISPGMNIVFAKQGYQYGGTLVNNTDICGQLESMNIWYKQLGP